MTEKLLRFYFKIYFSNPIWKIKNRKARKLWKNPSLPEALNRIVGDLWENGIASSSLEELSFPIGELLNELSQRETPTYSKQNYYSYYPTVTKFNFQDAFHRFAVDEKILNIAAGYMRMWPKFYYLFLTKTGIIQEKDPQSAQSWHRDKEDLIRLKVHVYLSDVDQKSGPFFYLKKSHYGGKYWNLCGHSFLEGSSFHNDSEVEPYVDPKDIFACLGKKGTVIFTDTSGLHKGGFSTGRERIMFTAGYRSSASPWRSFLKVLPHEKLSEMQEYALSPNHNPFSRKLYYYFKGVR